MSSRSEWTWESGTSDPPAGNGQPGVYGTIGTAAAGNVPGARGSGAGWADSSGNLWLYAGYGLDSTGTYFGSLSDVWKYDISSSQWTWVSGANTINALASYGTQGVAATTNRPGARSNFEHWIDNSGNLWVFGGSGYDAAGVQAGLGDFWKFEPGSGIWTWVGGSSGSFPAGNFGILGVAASGNIPGERENGATWTDAGGNLWLFGGYGVTAPGSVASGDDLNDLWEYSPATALWTRVQGTGNSGVVGVYGTLGTASMGTYPGSRESAQVWTDASGNVWLFGGYGFDVNGKRAWLNDLWELNPKSLAWTWVGGSTASNALGSYGTEGLAASTNGPGARSFAVTWTDNTGKLWLMGGYGFGAAGPTGDLGDMWSFDPAAKVWTWMGGGSAANGTGSYGTLGVASATNAPAGRDVAVGMKDASGNLWLFGGVGANSKGPESVGLNDLWKYQP